MSRDLNRIFVILPLCAAVILLGACSTANEIGSGVSKGFGDLGRSVSGMFETTTKKNEPSVPGIYDDRYYDSGYDQLATEMSDTSVQLYGLEGGAVSSRSRFNQDRTSQGMATNDPSVTVFPIDGSTRVNRDFQTPQSMYDNMPHRGYASSVPYPPSIDSSGSDAAFLPMTRNSSLQRGQDEVSQYSTMPNRIYFSHDSTQLTSGGHEVIGHVAKTYQGQKLSVEGHASERAEQKESVERKITNLKVSMDRALSASRALMQKGVPADAIETKAYGDTKPPLAPQGMSTEAAARRVEIYSR